MNNLIDQEIIKYSEKFKSKYNQVIDLIKSFNRIAIFRHVKPDYDAIGSQLGVYYFIKENFPNKDVVILGEDHITLTPKCFIAMDKINDEWFDKPFLAIIVDTSTSDRISDTRFNKATKIIKIDHHPEVDKYGDIQIVDDNISAAGELVANMLISFDEYKINIECASNLFKAIAGDSNRFLNSEVNTHTFAIAKYLLNKGINLNKIYNEMYKDDISFLSLDRYVLDHYKLSPNGVAYYVLDKEDVIKFNIQAEQGKDCLHLFDHFSSIHIWVSITYDIKTNLYRVSLRSDDVSVEEVATKYRGGGHPHACGAKLKSLEEVNPLINDLDNLLK